VNGPLYLVVL